MQDSNTARSDLWRETVSLLLDVRSIRMLFLGFASGLPLLLVFMFAQRRIISGVTSGAVK